MSCSASARISRSKSLSLSMPDIGEFLGGGGCGLSSLSVDDVDVYRLDLGVLHPVDSESLGKSESWSSSGGGLESVTDSVSAFSMSCLRSICISSSSSINLNSSS